jgi:hypothetical protein
MLQRQRAVTTTTRSLVPGTSIRQATNGRPARDVQIKLAAKWILVGRVRCSWIVKRLTLTAFMLLGLFASAVRLPASVCPVCSAPLGQACRMGCCANKCCCADSQKNHNLPSPPAAKDYSSNHEITAIVWATTTNFVTSSPSFDVSFGSWRVAPANSAPRQELLCTFLI